MTDLVLALFGTCPLCRQPSPGDDLACEACVDVARGFIRRKDGSTPNDMELGALLCERPTPEELAETARLISASPQPATSTADRQDGPVWRMNQHCWVCEHTRKCCPEPGIPGLWVCPDCLENTAPAAGED